MREPCCAAQWMMVRWGRGQWWHLCGPRYLGPVPDHGREYVTVATNWHLRSFDGFQAFARVGVGGGSEILTGALSPILGETAK